MSNKIQLLGLFLELTGQCNGHCPYCYNNSGTHGQELSFSEVIHSIKAVPEGKGITLSGGEPLLYSRFKDLIDEIFEIHRDPKVRIITNGSLLLDRDMDWNKLSKCEIQFTLESLDEKIQNQWRGEGAFRVLSTIKSRMVRYSTDGIYTLRININKKNILEIPEMIRRAEAWGVDILRFSFIQNKGRAKEADLSVSFDSQEGKRMMEYLSAVQSSITIDLAELYPHRGCDLMNQGIVPLVPAIDSTGKVYFCTKFLQTDYTIGSIYMDHLENILYSEKTEAMLESLRRRRDMIECGKCIWTKGCFKGCPAEAYEEYHSIYRSSDDCKYLKHYYTQRIGEVYDK